MVIKFEFWESSTGNSPPADFYNELGVDLLKKIKYIKEMIERCGLQKALISKHVQKICDGIYEIKISYKNRTELRLLVTEKNQIIYILDIFWKKDQKLKNRYIDLAIQRKNLII